MLHQREQSRQVERAERFEKLWNGWFKSPGRYTPIPRRLRRKLARMAAKGKLQIGVPEVGQNGVRG